MLTGVLLATVGLSLLAPAEPPIAAPLSPNDPALAASLQAWYKADSLQLADGKAVQVWPDSSGKGRDLSVTAGVRTGGVGTAPKYVVASSINRRPAVHFEIVNGLASSPDLPVDIKGDAALTIFLVVTMQPHEAQPPFDGILGIGDPANPGKDPGKPLAALIQIRRVGEPELQFAGGWNHDATLGPGSFKPFYDRPVMLGFVKKPGPMKTSTRIFIDGVSSEDSSIKRTVDGRDTVPDIRHRSDIGLYLGKALSWCGSIKGDLAEVIIYNKALTDDERAGVEGYLAERYGFVLPGTLKLLEAKFTPQQKAFWSFQPVKDRTPPDVKDSAWPVSPIDRFILAKLEEKSLKPNPPAERRALIRRVTFDLLGLPPTSEEIESFLADTSPDAFTKVVDRLLASPHYGERWGRHWLDVVRYADTTANDANAIMRYAFRYRDYVVSALNKDKPYDRFLIEQLAGDLLPASADPDELAEHVIATGYVMIGPKALAETDKEQSRMDVVDDQIDVTGRAFLGLTIGCARCHDHKFDPIPTVDYYALAGIFRSTEVFRDENRNATMWQDWELELPGRPALMVMAPKETSPRNLRVHLRGNRHNLGPAVPRRFLQILAGDKNSPLQTAQSGRLELARWIANRDNPLTARVMVNRIWQHHFGTGLVATSDNLGFQGEKPSHPELLDWLAARFIESGWSIKTMHRLMLLSSTYQMSCTPNDAGLQVDPNDRVLWRFPRLRLEAEALRDALLAVSGRLNRKIGGDETIDVVYKAGEVIDAKRGFVVNRVNTGHAVYITPCRSIYLPVIRNALPDVLALFDSADPNNVSPKRNDTTVPAQSLFMMNNPFVREQALELARTVLAEDGDIEAQAVRNAYRRVLGRKPDYDEIAGAVGYVEKYAARLKGSGKSAAESHLAAWQSFCQVLLCSNEFLYLE